MAKTTTVKEPAASAEVMNSLTDFVSQLVPFGFAGQQQQVSQIDTIFANTRYYLISNFRQVLSQAYVEHGIIKTMVNQPVDDAFRTGFEIKTSNLDGPEIEMLQAFLYKRGMIRALKQALKWARLFGGGAVLVITEQDCRTPLEIKRLDENSRIEFRAVDLWELYHAQINVDGYRAAEIGGMNIMDEFFDYYGHKVHRSRLMLCQGEEAPSYVRPRLRGWGMSVLEHVVRSLNQYLKNQDVVFELLDEAKIDVYKIKGFNTALLNRNGTDAISNRIQMANMVKNVLNALTMDAEDDYVQKQVSFTGLGEILVQIRQGIAADLRMPMTKLFGISAAGFNSGDDDIENYNAMIESEIREPSRYHVVDMVAIACQILYGFVPDDLRIEWRPLRILTAKEEEEVKTMKWGRVRDAISMGLFKDGREAKEAINKDGLLPVELDEGAEITLPEPGANDENPPAA